MDWDDLRIFETVAASPTLSSAARRLKIGIATVIRRIEGLERALELRLVERLPSGVRLTPDGAALIERARAVGGAVDLVRRAADELRQGAAHPVRITATEPIAAEILAPALPRLFQSQPGLRVEIAINNDIVSLAAREIDIALRLTKPQGDSLIAQRLPSITMGLYTSAAYLDGRDPAALVLGAEALLTYDDSYGPIAEVAWVERQGLTAAARLRASSTRVLLNATLAGCGIGLLPGNLARFHAALIPVPAPQPIPKRPVWLVSHRALRRSAPHRAVKAWIIETMNERERRAAGLYSAGSGAVAAASLPLSRGRKMPAATMITPSPVSTRNSETKSPLRS
jgi:DNA-binding transcriptional LysR family regulator